MAYFGGFPATYQPMYQQPMMQQQQQQQQQTGINWVQGEAGAKAYLVAPGQTVQLWDSEEKIIYLKSADASGMPSMKILDYTIRGEEQKTEVEYATKEDLKVLTDKVKSLQESISGKRRKLLMEEDDDE